MLFKKLEQIDDRYRELEQRMTLPECISNAKEYASLIKEYKSIEPIIEKYREYKINEKNIQVTRGNHMPLTVTTKNSDGTNYVFQLDDTLRFKVFEKKNVNNVFLTKDFSVNEVSEEITIELTADDMKIGELIDKATDYWYEIELNPDTPKTQTIIGYEKNLPAILTLLPEGGDK